MEISWNSQYLVLSINTLPHTQTANIYSSLTDALNSWGPCCRLSPIFGVKEFGTNNSNTGLFSGEHSLIFLGPTLPAVLADHFDSSYHLWLTLGMYNVIINAPTKEKESQIINFAKGNSIRYEVWRMNDDSISDVQYSPMRKHLPNLYSDFGELLVHEISLEMKELVKEYCTLMGSTLARSEQVVPSLLNDLLKLNDLVKGLIQNASDGNLTNDYTSQSLMTKLNAGLSRYCAQVFSGTSPIMNTECHYWTHSLLGTGIANLTIYQLYSFVQEKLGLFRIPQRLLKIKSDNELIRLDNLSYSNEFWYKDHLNEVTLSKEDLEKPLYPLISYFSGRDGFMSTLTTLSAPLAAISACNSRRWTLMTLTHEMSHIFVNACLGMLYPHQNSDYNIHRAFELLKSAPNNWIDEIRRLVLLTVLTMQKAEANNKSKYTVNELEKIFRDWYHKIEELMTHVFDFLYFYRTNTESYMKSLWLSWSVIPNIEHRVPEYVMRNLCAVLVLNLRRGKNAEDLTKEQVENALSDIKKEFQDLPYLDSALNYLRSEWKNQIRNSLIARKALVGVVRAFLFSKKAASDVVGESKLAGEKSKKEGYSKRIGYLDKLQIDSPLRFLEIYTSDKAPSARDSHWIFSTITFNSKDVW